MNDVAKINTFSFSLSANTPLFPFLAYSFGSQVWYSTLMHAEHLVASVYMQ